MKDFVCASILNNGDRFEGKAIQRKKILSPLAKNFITKERLTRVSPNTSVTRESPVLFTDDKPTLSCNQRVIYVPTKDYQLVMTSDWSEKGLSCTSVGND